MEVNDLQTCFKTRDGTLRAVDGLSFSIASGETLAIVGESGCGKSVTAMSVLGLLPRRLATVQGTVRFSGRDLLALSERQMREIRGKEIGMIFQEPMTSLNPVFTIGQQLIEAILIHRRVDKSTASTRAVEMLRLVGIPAPEQRMSQYPHALSGGMRQRVMIAIALSCAPKLLIADEPTTALDVTIQAQVLDLMRDLRNRLQSAVLLITHDLGVVAQMAQRVVVMYAGRRVEEGAVRDIFHRPMHPYTRGLLGAVPKVKQPGRRGDERLAEIPGTVPSMRYPISGCAFAERCALAKDICRTVTPPVARHGAVHLAACHLA